MTSKYIPKYAAVACSVIAAFSLVGCKQEAVQRPAVAPLVEVLSVETSSPMMTTTLSGRTNAYRIAEVRPQVSGIILKRTFIEGQDVKEGDPLYQIDPSLFEAAYEQAKANYNLALAEANRTAKLLKVNAVSKQVYDQAQASMKTAKAALKTAKTNLDYTMVQSPLTGRVGRSEVTPGALVNAFQANQLTTVQQLDPIYVDVRQSLTDHLRFKRELANGTIKATGNAVKVTLLMEDGSTYPLSGKLTFTGESVDEGTGMINLRAEFPNPDKVLLPGMFVRAQIDEGTRNNSVILDQRCVLHDQKGQAFVYIVTPENKIERRIVTANRAIGTSWLIESGLKAGEKVVLKGLQSIRDGVTVRVAGQEVKK